ncbi:MAG TPA: hypothetical protein VGN28_03755 [Blastococcus sp.]|nr:hypothetical protein [Blastococcus sp.]
MDVLCTDLAESIRLDLVLARLELAEARESQCRKDTPAARRRVADARAQADRLLDMWNESAPAPA